MCAHPRPRRSAPPPPPTTAGPPARQAVQPVASAAGPLIGRADDLAAIRASLQAGVRLLTLTGPAGVGKTSLALALAMAPGTLFVPLAAIDSVDGVAGAIARTLGLRDPTMSRDPAATDPGPGDTREASDPAASALTAVLIGRLRDQPALLILDNFEHVIQAASLAQALLAACPHLQVLVTSRRPLRLYGEHEYTVAPLMLPLPGDDSGTPAAVQLFVRRAQAVDRSFRLTAENVAATSELCRRLDGLPLALELSAARMRLFSPAALLAELEERPLWVTADGARDLPARQRTLRDAIAWSYDLLPPDEQRAFRTLAVFASSFTIADAAEMLAPASSLSHLPESSAANIVAALVEKSLLARAPSQCVSYDPAYEGSHGGHAPLQESLLVESAPRFTMLRTLREFALERLVAAEEAMDIQRRHAARFLALAEQAAPALHGPHQLGWLERLTAADDDLRAAMRWARARAEAGAPDAALLGLRLASALHWYWVARGQLRDGLDWLLAFLAMPFPLSGPAHTATRIASLCATGPLGLFSGRHNEVRPLLDEALAHGTAAGDTRLIGRVRTWIGNLLVDEGDVTGGHTLLAAAVDDLRNSGESWDRAFALLSQARAARLLDRVAPAPRLCAEAIACFRALDDLWGHSAALAEQGSLSLHAGDVGAAERYFAESLAMRRQARDPFLVAQSLSSLGDVARCAGDYRRAEALAAQSLALFARIGSSRDIAVTLVDLAWLAQRRADHWRAAILLGAAEARLHASGTSLDPGSRASWDQLVAAARAALGPSRFATAWSEGRTGSLTALHLLDAPPADTAGADQVAFTANAADPVAPAAPAPERSDHLAVLTARESEVLKLIASGLTTSQVAAQLVISPVTVSAHLRAIYGKLGVSTRASVTRYAIEHHLV